MLTELRADRYTDGSGYVKEGDKARRISQKFTIRYFIHPKADRLGNFLNRY